MTKRQGCDEFGLNFQIGKDDSVEIQTNFDVVIFIELASNRLSVGDFTVRCDEKLPRYSRIELRLASVELDLRYSAIVVLVEFGNLRRVFGRQRQCCLQSVRALSDREAT